MINNYGQTNYMINRGQDDPALLQITAGHRHPQVCIRNPGSPLFSSCLHRESYVDRWSCGSKDVAAFAIIKTPTCFGKVHVHVYSVACIITLIIML